MNWMNIETSKKEKRWDSIQVLEYYFLVCELPSVNFFETEI